jgi:hypothetical protein
MKYCFLMKQFCEEKCKFVELGYQVIDLGTLLIKNYSHTKIEAFRGEKNYVLTC